MQMQEMEEREANQKQMYDKLFTALDEKGTLRPNGLHAASSKELLHPDNLNATGGSWFGKNAVEDMQKQYTEQIQARVAELESLVNNKDEYIDNLTAENASLQKIHKSGAKSEVVKNQELEIRITNLQRQLEQKNEDISKLKIELDDRDEDIKMLTQTFEHEYELLRKENEKNVIELQKTFKENIEKSRPSSNLTASNAKHMQVADDDVPSTFEQSSHKSDFHTPSSKPPMVPVSHHKNYNQTAPKPIQIPKET